MSPHDEFLRLPPKTRERVYQACRAQVGTSHRISPAELVQAHKALKGAA